MKKLTADDVIRILNLKPLPAEGGFYRETYRGPIVNAPATIFGIKSASPRVTSTAIYYLIRPESFSALHKISSDEIFHFYAGDPVEMVQITSSGELRKITMGTDLQSGQEPQVCVPKNIWQGLKLQQGGAWALLGTTVAPGFEFEDFVLGQREIMLQEYPQHKDVIFRYT